MRWILVAGDWNHYLGAEVTPPSHDAIDENAINSGIMRFVRVMTSITILTSATDDNQETSRFGGHRQAAQKSDHLTMMFGTSIAVHGRNLLYRSVSRRWFSSRPFRILGVQQIAIGAEDRAGLTHLWQDVFGLSATSSHRIEKENVEEDIIKLGPSPYEVEVDLMTPIDPDASPKVSNCKQHPIMRSNYRKIFFA